MIDMTAYKIDAVGPPWRYVLRKDGEPVYVSSETAITRGDAVRQGVIDRPRLVASIEGRNKHSTQPRQGH